MDKLIEDNSVNFFTSALAWRANLLSLQNEWIEVDIDGGEDCR